MQHQAFVIQAEAEKGIEVAQSWVERELKMKAVGNPDILVLRHGLLSVEDARRVSELAAGVAFRGQYRVIIVSAIRAYHEAQNALLKIFEEPPPGTYLFLVLPTFGGLLPTLRSRVGTLVAGENKKLSIPDIATQFIKASHDKRSALIKKLTSGKDEDERRELREEALTLLHGVESAAYRVLQKERSTAITKLLTDISVLRAYLYDRSAPVRMILEHISIVTPKNLV